mmetsp:Transcript_35977/g.92663  ORF Transcript_35977/g.92663 Transcript_35977/m.92663 type:complete len:294 (+) Transcript_35977:600-1481(+)
MLINVATYLRGGQSRNARRGDGVLHGRSAWLREAGGTGRIVLARQVLNQADGTRLVALLEPLAPALAARTAWPGHFVGERVLLEGHLEQRAAARRRRARQEAKVHLRTLYVLHEAEGEEARFADVRNIGIPNDRCQGPHEDVSVSAAGAGLQWEVPITYCVEGGAHVADGWRRFTNASTELVEDVRAVLDEAEQAKVLDHWRATQAAAGLSRRRQWRRRGHVEGYTVLASTTAAVDTVERCWRRSDLRNHVVRQLLNRLRRRSSHNIGRLGRFGRCLCWRGHALVAVLRGIKR